MKNENTKPLVIYHADCADGFAAAYAAYLHFNYNAEYVPLAYDFEGTSADELWAEFVKAVPQARDLKHRQVYLLDFSFTVKTVPILYRLQEKVKSLVWLDHHKSSFEAVGAHPDEEEFNYLVEEGGKNTEARLHRNKSGAVLAWEHFRKGQALPKLFKHVDDRDRWVFEVANTNSILAAMYLYAPWTFEMFGSLVTWCENEVSYNELCARGATSIQVRDQQVELLVANAVPCKLPGTDLVGLASNCPRFLRSEVGHELAKASGTYGIAWYVGKNGKAHCSIRSVKGVQDVEPIALALGGGGHGTAAGFGVDAEQFLQYLIFNKG